VADGFGGGASRERKLEIMRDSRIGTYGVCVLAISFMLRASALTSLSKPALVAFALVAAHTAARAALPAFMALVPPARSDGLSAGVGRPPTGSILTASLIGIIALGVSFGITAGVMTLVLVLFGFVFMAWICVRQIGGQTGDVLGALEQVCETMILLSAAAAV
jgi:adenosylcobinamide-GDP ribazoletransferase